MSTKASSRGSRRGIRAARVAALALLAFALPVSAQWVWRDANGRMTASDRPPPREIAEKDILSRPGPTARGTVTAAVPVPASAPAPAPRAASAASPLQAEVEARRRATEQAQAAKAKEEEQRLAAARAQNCTRARQHVATIESGMRMARVNEKGEREYLDEKALAEEMARARAVIASDCR